MIEITYPDDDNGPVECPSAKWLMEALRLAEAREREQGDRLEKLIKRTGETVSNLFTPTK